MTEAEILEAWSRARKSMSPEPIVFVHCGDCRRAARPLARVWHTDEGPLYESEGKVGIARMLEARKQEGRKQPATTGVFFNLIELDQEPQTTPRMRCPHHGIIDVPIAKVRSAVLNGETNITARPCPSC